MSSGRHNFGGARVLSLESRRGEEMQRLIENHEGIATVVPSLREIPLESSAALPAFAKLLQSNAFDVTILTTGVGTRMLGQKLDAYVSREEWTRALQSTLVVARGPKPVPVLREWDITVDVAVPSPNTWREILQALDTSTFSLRDATIAIQDFPTLDPRFITELEARGARVLRLPVYRYELPEDVAPLRHAVLKLVGGGFDCALFTAGVQLWHLLRVAMWMNLETDCLHALSQICLGAVGPTCAEVLRECGLSPDVVPQHPKMGHLIKECALRCDTVLQTKRALKAA